MILTSQEVCQCLVQPELLSLIRLFQGALYHNNTSKNFENPATRFYVEGMAKRTLIIAWVNLFVNFLLTTTIY